MNNLQTLSRQAKELATYAKRMMPKEVSEVWLWTAQNAFLTETNPETGARWADRYGVAFGKGFRESGNVERHLSYKKLHRTGRLLRGLKVKHISTTSRSLIKLYNNVPYASEHETGVGNTGGTTVKPPYTRGGVTGVHFGGNVVARPHMVPSKQVLRAPMRLLCEKMKEFGW